MTSSLAATGGFTLADPHWLLLLLALALAGWLRGRRGQPVWIVPFVTQWSGRDVMPRSRLPIWLVVAGIALLVVAMARPQKVEDRRIIQQEGYDIVLAIDLSGSMLAEDYEREGSRINRLQAVKPIIEAFMARRSSDRIGVVTFGGRAYTLAPLSFDHRWLRKQVGRLRVGLIEDGTAVGDALALSISRLGQVNREEGGKRLGGFVILLTDGANNSGSIEPLEAAELARVRGIPVYTIGAGDEGPVPMPVFDDDGVKVGYRRVVSDLDEATLERIAAVTGGRYFRATDSGTVDAAFAAIDRERKIEFEAKSNLRAHEFFQVAAWPGAAFCLAGFWLSRPGRRGELA
jgi:Ca-activated chloride channel family protein